MAAFAASLSAAPFRGVPLTQACPRTRPASRTVAQRPSPRAKLDALLFDCDGVLADTERDGHRAAFNLAFSQRDLPDVWDAALYGKLLETGGGKERMTAYWNEVGWPAAYADDHARTQLVKELHKRKTELFMQVVADGLVPLRPGVQRLFDEAYAAGVPVAVCSTSNERSVAAIVAQMGPAVLERTKIFAGDMAKKKKPSPDIYNLAAQEMRLDSSNVCVVEDSHIGVCAARAAGMPVVVTKSTYTVNEDFAQAQRVVESLDEPLTTLHDLTDMVIALKVSA